MRTNKIVCLYCISYQYLFFSKFSYYTSQRFFIFISIQIFSNYKQLLL